MSTDGILTYFEVLISRRQRSIGQKDHPKKELALGVSYVSLHVNTRGLILFTLKISLHLKPLFHYLSDSSQCNSQSFIIHNHNLFFHSILHFSLSFGRGRSHSIILFSEPLNLSLYNALHRRVFFFRFLKLICDTWIYLFIGVYLPFFDYSVP